MNNEKDGPKRPDRFEIPQYLIDEIDSVGEKYEDRMSRLDNNEQPDDEELVKKRIRIVELLETIRQSSTSESYEYRKRAEVAMSLLKEMGVPIDLFDHLIGMNYPSEMIADKLIEEARDSDSEK